jgi:hypothetical protein
MPIASVVPPTTLTVVCTEINKTTLQYVPTVSFDNLNFLAAMPASWEFLSEGGERLTYYKY